MSLPNNKQPNFDQGMWRVRIAGDCGSGASGKKLSGSERSILNCLARNIFYDPKKPRTGTANNLTHISVLSIAEGTGYSEDTVIRALSSLKKEHKLIARHIRDGNLRKSRKTFLNWDLITAGRVVTTYAAKAAEQEQRHEDDKDEDDSGREPGVTGLTSYEDLEEICEPSSVSPARVFKPQPKALVYEEEDDLEIEEARANRDEDRQYVDAIVNLFQEHFRGPDNVKTDQSRDYLRQNLIESVEFVGSAEALFNLCSKIFADQTPRGLKTIAGLGGSRNLANYLLGGLKGDLLTRFADDDEVLDTTEELEDHDEDDFDGHSEADDPLQLGGESRRSTRLIYLDHTTLSSFAQTGVLDLSDDEKRILGPFRFVSEVGEFYGGKLEFDGRWKFSIDNVTSGAKCRECLGSGWRCHTLQDAQGNTLVLESDQACTSCDRTA